MRTLFAAAFLSSATAALAAPPIIGGTATKVGDFPSVVGIGVGTGLCTGTLIAPTWVLTAGHCIDPTVVGEADHAGVVQSIIVIVNSVDVTQPGGIRVRAKEAFGDGFDKDHFGAHDIALIQLATPVTAVAPMAVNLAAAKAPIGISVTMVGYGATVGGTMNAGKEFVVTNRTSGKCDDVVPRLQGLDPPSDKNVMCYAQTDGKGKCEGDSGGPSIAMIDGAATVVGITSFGDTNCQSFGVDTRTDIEADFLLSHDPELCPTGDCGSDDGGCCAIDGGPARPLTALAGTGLVGLALRRRRR